MASSAFRAQRLTPTTFLVKEYDDIYDEKPHIYVKVVQEESTILIVDTGCGGSMKDHGHQSSNTVRSLRKFIEIVPVSDNGGLPLNPNSAMDYMVILTHCHYDHIRDTSSPIIVSGYDPTFLSPSALPEHTLCNRLHISVPKYTPSLVSNFHDIFSGRIGAPRVTILHTPGHTPDELAVYDWEEGMLYVGDTLYEDEPIIFPKEGSIVTWFKSMEFLVGFTRERNTELERDGRLETLINAGHCTARKPALEVLTSTVSFMRDVVSRKERVVEYKQESGRYSLRCPERLVEDVRKLDN
ncbi:beta-lactamase-like protein [Panaeolus papilionaceus]|nr:beta-lactamase-like protein [Panaeolus papilionaceus]